MAAENQPIEPRRVDRAALERVLARAAELQIAASDRLEGDELSEADIVSLGEEAGLSQEHLRLALAEERARGDIAPTSASPLGLAVFGPVRISSTRIVAGAPDKVLASLDQWMQAEEGLQVKRHFGDRIVWEPRRDFITNLRRTLNVGGRGYGLTRLGDVHGTVVPLDDKRCVATLEIDLSSHRGRLVKGTAAATLGGAAAATALVVMGILIPVAVSPLIVFPAVAFLSGRQFQHATLQRATLTLEQILDRLERGDLGRPQSLLGALTSAAIQPRR